MAQSWRVTRRSTPRNLPPLDPAALDRLALRYVERFATTRARLARYLATKLQQRGWSGDGDPDPAAVADRMAALGYVDDTAYAGMKAASLGRRGYGGQRVRQALRHAGVDAADAAPAILETDAAAARTALAFARRRGIGPYADAPADRDMRQRQLARMIRAGHGFALARAIVDAEPGVFPELPGEDDPATLSI